MRKSVAARCVAKHTRWHSEKVIANVRNIGVVAHIDAGKTTTTERMLFFSQSKGKMGDVDAGNTTTDYMDQERERGITIQSALTKLKWGNLKVWIIDTPGHVDFTMEVERTLRVLDGAVAVFDAVKGVEAQSRTVLQQAEKFQIPFVTFINKMDRSKADYTRAIDSVEKLIGIPVLPVQAPYYEDERFVGFFDLFTMTVVRWNAASELEIVPSNTVPPIQRDKALSLRARLLDSLGGVSDAIADAYLECLDSDDEAGLAIPSDIIKQEVAKATKARSATPSLLGSAAKSIGIQPLLDAVGEYLPSPVDRPPLVTAPPESQLVSKDFRERDPFAAVVFKVQVQGKDLKSVQRATLVRVYSGVLKPGMKIYNSTRDVSQTVKSISVVDGEDLSISVDSLGPGSVGCVWGLNRSFTGDTLCTEKKSAFLLDGVLTPPPVVSMSIEPYSEREEKILEQALEVVMLEDPSVSCSVNEFGQTVVSGMGSLHLEVTKIKIERGWNIELTAGAVKVKHRETVTAPVSVMHTFITHPGDTTSGACSMELLLTPLPEAKHGLIDLEQQVTMSLSGMLDEEDSKQKLRKKWLPCIKRGVQQGLGAGPIARDMVCGVCVDVVTFKLLPRGNEDTVGNAADYTTKLLLQEAKAVLIEPCMEVGITMYDTGMLDVVSQDMIGARRGDVIEQTYNKATVHLTCIAPVSELTTYTSKLLSLTGGDAHHTTTFKGYRIVTDATVVERVQQGRM
eukprot:TRINITY_DN11286_c0_g1_i1.p1 TRINITY_DN11286_c0_g1~~TRINITY_DN11286_c0_g1_i1.p1  ORF type:complete len:754 (+),score=210.17 TRINITY_DN11286_c0_g1_i1:57-2264(+)